MRRWFGRETCRVKVTCSGYYVYDMNFIYYFEFINTIFVGMYVRSVGNDRSAVEFPLIMMKKRKPDKSLLKQNE